MNKDFEMILNEMHKNLENPQWLSEMCVILSTNLYYHNSKMAVAEKQEKEIIVRWLDKPTVKKISVAEAEKRAVVETDNLYGKYKVQGEAIQEIINSMKMRLRVLGWERGNKEPEI